MYVHSFILIAPRKDFGHIFQFFVAYPKVPLLLKSKQISLRKSLERLKVSQHPGKALSLLTELGSFGPIAQRTDVARRRRDYRRGDGGMGQPAMDAGNYAAAFPWEGDDTRRGRSARSQGRN